MLMMERKGDVVFRTVQLPEGLVRHTFNWIADSAGDAIYCGFEINGEALEVDYVQTDGNATGTWTWTLQDAMGRDGLESLVATVTVQTSGRKVLHQVLHSGQQSRGLMLAGKYAFVVDCSDASARSGWLGLVVRP